MVVNSELTHWTPAARQFNPIDNPLKVPFEVAIREALRAATFLRKRLRPTKRLPGLVDSPGMSQKLADELISIVRAVQQAQLQYLMEDEEVLPFSEELSPEAHAKDLLSKIDAALAYLLRGQLSDTERSLIEKIRKMPERTSTNETSLQLALAAYAETSQRVRPQLALLGRSFDLNLLEEVPPLIAELEQSLIDKTKHTSRVDASRRLFHQMLTLMQERVNQIRTVAGFVFREHPTIIRQVTSAHERRRRAQNRAASPGTR